MMPRKSLDFRIYIYYSLQSTKQHLSTRSSNMSAHLQKAFALKYRFDLKLKLNVSMVNILYKKKCV